MLPLIIGQTYYLSIKIHHALSAVNGTECELVSIVPGNGRPSALVVRIRAPSVPFQVRMLPPNCLLLLPHTATFSVAISLLAGCKVEGPITVQRTQFALVYGIAITAHKAQGKTLQRLLRFSFGPPGRCDRPGQNDPVCGSIQRPPWPRTRDASSARWIAAVAVGAPGLVSRVQMCQGDRDGYSFMQARCGRSLARRPCSERRQPRACRESRAPPGRCGAGTRGSRRRPGSPRAAAARAGSRPGSGTA